MWAWLWSITRSVAEDADAALADYIDKFQRGWAFRIAEIYAYRGEKNKGFDWLERSARNTIRV